MNTRLKKHYENVAELGCVLCRHLGYRDTPCEIHHIRRFGTKRDRAPVIGLCPEHHRGNTGVHGLGRKAFAVRYNITEEDLLEITNKLLQEDL
ncbi:Recombination enhancement, RecA-dependent nuclease [uncultured Caudovirales phage]|uniref:Recombination enhancement, RecA-dependent nuclease n=1 Tax=uncultured Caudovirales phage TaxID=2100421 RepID=A0A6J5M066_9CAUD|nr:Recombination enhancement, RecA-dependent nuclease [uncultured Caudovirales phage]